ncbi:MAG: DUF5060 domain-containing protein, partial [Planctomycetes bacterium]|nr:DUF5060 domain-containing protein [Planctomycetota bacterium]
MKTKRLPVILGACLLFLFPAGALTAELSVDVTQNTDRLMPYQVFELTFGHTGRYDDPTWDVTIDVELTSPAGRKINIGGFFFGSSRPQKPVIRQSPDGHGGTRSTATWPCDPADLWKARYAPSQLGTWKFAYTFRNRAGGLASGGGTFEVVSGRACSPVKRGTGTSPTAVFSGEEGLPLGASPPFHRAAESRGWVRINPENPFRFVFDDGTPYYPIGFQDGIFDNNSNGSAMDSFSMEGPFRLDRLKQRPQTPPGALFARGPSMNPTNGDVHFGKHARAGFNLWRFSPNNFSIKVFSLEGEHGPAIHWAEAAMVDEMLRMTRKYDIRVFYGIFGFTKAFNEHPENEEDMERVKRIIKYSVDRWGAYVDFWELLNEQKASDRWYEITVPYLKSIDPYGKPVATSWERPELPGIDINAPHWYGNENELTSDRVSANRARQTKRFGKPVVYGEQGNNRGREDRSGEGIGGVWDPGSARRMRVRCWTALFNEIHFIFWETSYAKDGHYMNLWIGPEERQYIRAMQDFAYHLDAGVKPVEVPLGGPRAREVRAYGLRSQQRTAVYLHQTGCATCDRAARADGPHHHRWDHDRGRVGDLEVTVDVPIAAKGYWYDPSNARIHARIDVPAGRQTLVAPTFSVDLALLIT